MICGLGLGWSKDEYQASNIPFMNRGERTDEFIQVLNKIWTDDIVEFKGKYYNIPASKICPKPFQTYISKLFFIFTTKTIGGTSSKIRSIVHRVLQPKPTRKVSHPPTPSSNKEGRKVIK
jgi:hypothetical protein